jgi:ParB family chromosome partitioning protein
VRETERLVQQEDQKPPPSAARKIARKNADIIAAEKDLADTLGMKVELKDSGEGHGVIAIHYDSLEQFDHLCRKLKR